MMMMMMIMFIAVHMDVEFFVVVFVLQLLTVIYER